jgi:hypothetical protein
VDQQVVVYLSALIRAVIALHNLVNNKLENRSRELKVSPWFFFNFPEAGLHALTFAAGSLVTGGCG